MVLLLELGMSVKHTFWYPTAPCFEWVGCSQNWRCISPIVERLDAHDRRCEVEEDETLAAVVAFFRRGGTLTDVLLISRLWPAYDLQIRPRRSSLEFSGMYLSIGSYFVHSSVLGLQNCVVLLQFWLLTTQFYMQDILEHFKPDVVLLDIGCISVYLHKISTV